jgi:hypothetical protein
MEIGEPKRVYTIEPVEDPIPRPLPEPDEPTEPAEAPEEPDKVPG